MFYTFKNNGNEFVDWRNREFIQVDSNKPIETYSPKGIYSGGQILPEEPAIFILGDDKSIGIGDCIGIISYLKDIHRIKGRGRCNLTIAASQKIQKMFKQFLPKTINYIDTPVEKNLFDSYTHKIESIFFDEDTRILQKSPLQRMYEKVCIEYKGISDFTSHTNQDIVFPADSFYERLGIIKGEKYVFFQWESAGTTKNLPPKMNIRLINHLTKNYGLKVYVISTNNNLKSLEKIPGVINLSGKTDLLDLFSLAINAQLIVCPDSLGLHLSEAYKIPCVCINSIFPPTYIANKYEIPVVMFGNGYCIHKPCGMYFELPKKYMCPEETNDYCHALSEIDIAQFDKSIKQTFENRRNYKSRPAINFYTVFTSPISLE